MQGKFIGVGVGPGDPELITLKAARCIQQAPVIAYLSNAEGASQARQIAAPLLQASANALRELPIVMPMSTERSAANAAYDSAATAIASELSAGHDVVFLCEGDPLFFGSYSYLLERLEDRFRCEAIPGISSMHAASAALSLPLALLSESLAVVSGRHEDALLRKTLLRHDTVLILKAGAARERILTALETTNRLGDARYLEYIGREQQRIESDVRQLTADPGPYFSLFVVSRRRSCSP